MEMDLMPSMPYYDLPAGLMAPLVKVGIAITIFICHLMTEIIFFQWMIISVVPGTVRALWDCVPYSLLKAFESRLGFARCEFLIS